MAEDLPPRPGETRPIKSALTDRARRLIAEAPLVTPGVYDRAELEALVDTMYRHGSEAQHEACLKELDRLRSLYPFTMPAGIELYEAEEFAEIDKLPAPPRRTGRWSSDGADVPHRVAQMRADKLVERLAALGRDNALETAERSPAFAEQLDAAVGNGDVEGIVIDGKAKPDVTVSYLPGSRTIWISRDTWFFGDPIASMSSILERSRDGNLARLDPAPDLSVRSPDDAVRASLSYRGGPSLVDPPTDREREMEWLWSALSDAHRPATDSPAASPSTGPSPASSATGSRPTSRDRGPTADGRA